MIQFDKVSYAYPEEERLVFDKIDLSIPKGITSLVGQNGTGKSTLLLLSAALIMPTEGKVLVNGVESTQYQDFEKRKPLVSFVYQNMEFESEEPVLKLLRQVYANGYHDEQDFSKIDELVSICELESVLDKKTQHISKGELQRVIIAFSVLYGTKIIIMDEPLFALEPYQKKKIMNYLKEYSVATGTPIIYSAHELEITEEYSDNVIFFYKNAAPKINLTKEVFTQENLEEVYGIPYAMLKKKEYLFREALSQS